MVAVGGLRYARAAERLETARRIAAVERTGVERERRLAGEERLRIARELHDALGHHISLISVQATAALHALRRPVRPPAGDPGPALGAIKETSGKALRELGAVLDILRTDDTGLDRLGAMVEDVRSTGLTVRTDIEPAPPLPRETDVAAYRILQEALTNVTRHAGASSVDIAVRCRDGHLELDVWDDGRGDHCGRTGNGLRGMAERAGSLGGRCVAGPVPEGGFRVRVRLPLGTSR